MAYRGSLEQRWKDACQVMAENEIVDLQEDAQAPRLMDFDVEISVGVRFPADAGVPEQVRELMRFRGVLISAKQMMTSGMVDLLTAGEVEGRMRTALSVWITGGTLAVDAAIETVDDHLAHLGMPTVSLYEVESSNVVAMGWADPHEVDVLPVAVVEFVGGSLYAYEGVPEDVFRNWWEADSQGVYLNTHIKGEYDFRRLV